MDKIFKDNEFEDVENFERISIYFEKQLKKINKKINEKSVVL